jgi:subtilisin family serine protease
MKKNIPLLGLSLLFLFVTAITGIVQAATDWPDKVDPRLTSAMNRQPEVEFLVVLGEQADLTGVEHLRDKDARGNYVYRTLASIATTTQAPIRALLDENSVAYRSYWVNNMIWVRGDRELVHRLARRGDVANLYLNQWQRMDLPSPIANEQGRQQVAGVEWNIALVGAPEVWANGFNGQGTVIGGQDTGYDWTHPAIIAQYRGWDGMTATHSFNWHDAIHEDNPNAPPGNVCGFDAIEPCDDNDHGTHTMGTMVGDDGGEQAIGIAPGAEWIGCRNMEDGWGTPTTYAECYEWFIAPYPIGGNSFTDGDPSKAPDVINNSWACPPAEGCLAADVLQQVVENVRAAGIVTVHSAGNSGALGCSTVNQPASIYDASFTVGATDNRDQIAFFSSRGPVTVDGSNRLKPDIVAPGEGVRSSIPGGDYAYLSGTSMASPHVAGLAALLISVNPALSGQVENLEKAITQTALPITTNEGCGGNSTSEVPNNVYGWGRIDAFAAYQAVRPIIDPFVIFVPLSFIAE